MNILQLVKHQVWINYQQSLLSWLLLTLPNLLQQSLTGLYQLVYFHAPGKLLE